MNKPCAITIAEHFSALSDPRVDRTKDHLLSDILTIAICAVIAGADTWVAIERFGQSKYDWFKSFLPLPNGIPSHDTFGRVFAALDPTTFSACFSAWMASIAQLTQGQVVAVDGNTRRGSFDTASAKAAIHRVSAWACSHHLLLGPDEDRRKIQRNHRHPATAQAVASPGLPRHYRRHGLSESHRQGHC